jgi:fermentation-respiration switch protein FrsA (DUF1100 family)
MSHGYSAVKEMGLEPYAEAFAAAGFAVLAFDYRFLGASEGTPRGRIMPYEQHDDIRAALTWVCEQPGVDKDRIGLWGESFSAGHALFVGALDPRVKVIVAVVPAMGLAQTLNILGGGDLLRAAQTPLIADHAARQTGGQSREIAVVAQKGTPCVLGGREAFEWFTERGAGKGWVNQTTVECHARMMDYVPESFMEFIAPRPLLIQAARNDRLVPLKQIEAAYERAGEPKRLDILDGGHFDIDEGKPLHEAAKAGALEWFSRWLKP